MNQQLNKTKWPDGPWLHEPDQKQWTDEATGYPCMMRRSYMGTWCGYVVVPPGHRLEGKSYVDVEECVSVHNGPTFSARHESGGWVIGFDCGHSDDFWPGLPLVDPAQYRDLGYVVSEVTELARQLFSLTIKQEGR